MLSHIVTAFSSLFPPGVEQLVIILFYCWFAFSIAGVIYAVIRIVSSLKELFRGAK